MHTPLDTSSLRWFLMRSISRWLNLKAPALSRVLGRSEFSNRPTRDRIGYSTWFGALLLTLFSVDLVPAAPQEQTTQNEQVVQSKPITQPADDQPALKATPDQVRDFENHVRPLLVSRCLECHGESKQEGGLRLDRREAILEGGDSGPAIDLQEPAASLLLEAVHYESFEMPPDAPLAESEIASLEAWVAEGSPWPDDAVLRMARKTAAEFSVEDRSHWSFQPVGQYAPPEVTNQNWGHGDIDRFILFRLEQAGISPSEQADRRVLIRRLAYDITGLPPTVEQTRRFLSDTRDDAYERIVNEFLDSSRHGERWAQFWLDLVRYADSDGYKADFARPDAWRYRDYVIDSFNKDKPYDRFVVEQLAGDEVAPSDPDALVATGFLRHWIYEYNQRDAESQWQIILDDVTETTADAFLGLGFSCARCHDHKYDPILQSDYFRMQAFFSSIYPRDDLYAIDPSTRLEYEQQLADWEEATHEIRAQMAVLEAQPLKNAEHRAVTKFPAEIQALYHSAHEDRTTYENQIWHLIHLQVLDEQIKVKFDAKLKDEKLEEWKRLRDQLVEFDDQKPEPLPKAFGVTDWGIQPATTAIPGDPSSEQIEPGFMVLFDDSTPTIRPLEEINSTGRRTVLANWIASDENPLTSRVIVNRVWQQYFGRGLVDTPSDLGRLGGKPSHPMLLDYLARRFMDEGWSLKKLHFWIVTSATYRQASRANNDSAAMIDPENRLLWRMNRKRLDGEQLRDAMLLVSGELNTDPGGPAVGDAANRRSIYGKVMRNNRHPLLDVFDFPDRIKSVGGRNQTITPNQALTLLNGPWIQARAESLASQTSDSNDFDLRRSLMRVMDRTVNRIPTNEEFNFAQSFFETQMAIASEQVDDETEAKRIVWSDLCSVLLNTNEFLYVD